MNKKRCTKCGIKKPMSEFHCDVSRPDNKYGQCKSCVKAKMHLYYNRPGGRERSAQQRKRYKNNLRQRMFDLLGHTCKFCGCAEERMLTVDHIEGDGNQHRKSFGVNRTSTTTMYLSILHDSNAKKKYRMLCWQCNSTLPLYGSERLLKAAIRREHKRIKGNS